MKRSRATVITSVFKQNIFRLGLWALLALWVLIASTGCAATARPVKEREQGQADVAAGQDAPPTGTPEVITVDLNDVDLNAVPSKPGSKASDEPCANLHGPLLQVVEAADPVREAQALALNVRQDQVQVTLVLNDKATAFLRLAGVDVGKQSGKQVQAYVPISRLCELAADKRVDAIYPANQAETQ